MRNLYLLSIVLLFSVSTQAQNWKTVVSGDTTYFRGGQHESIWPFIGPEYSDILRMILISSSNAISGDSVFQFYNTVRGVDMVQCLDTTAPSWLGKMFIRKNDGTELYFNGLNDTITFKSLAQLGDSWVIARDSNNLTFEATLAYAGLTNIEGGTDSFKRATIQAYQNGNPVSHPYNNKVLEWTKEHGWLKTLDMYRFPNQGNGWEEFGTYVDSATSTRIDNDFAHVDIEKIDLLWKYAPGNEWIHHREGGSQLVSGPYNGAYKTITHDSIINSTLLTANAIIVDYQRKIYTVGNWQLVTGTNPYWDSLTTSSTTLHTDTILNTSTSLLADTIRPELVHPGVNAILTTDQDKLHNRYFVDTFCGRPILKYYQIVGSVLFYSNNCWQLGSSLGGGMVTSSENLTGFGELKYFHAYSGFTLSPQYLNYYLKEYHSYLKLGSCTYGTKIDVIALNTGDVVKENDIAVYPNPANEFVIVRSSYADKGATLNLTDVNGRLLWQQTGVLQENKIDTKQLAPGLYFVKLQGKGAMQVAKVVVQ